MYPIIWAAGRGHAEIVHLLLQHGAKVNCSDKVTNPRQMFYYVHLSYYYSNNTHRGNHLYKFRRVHFPPVFPFVTAPEAASPFNLCDLILQYGTTPLIWAARKGHYDSVMHLLANGADVDQEGAVCRL